ncbi:MAG: ribonuclease R [Clostridium sp.]
MGIKQTVIDFMREEAYRPMDISELVTVFDIKTDEYKAFKKALKTMEKEGAIVRTKKDRFALPEKLGIVKGRFQAHPKGFGFLIPEVEGEKDVFIPASSTNSAMNGDTVIVQVIAEDKVGRKREGEVVQVLKRNNKKVIGVYEDSRNFGFVVPEDARLTGDIFVSKKEKNGAKDGDVVIVELTNWPDRRRSAEGVVVEILGQKGDRGLDILTIIKKHGLPEEFPDKVIRFAENISEEIEAKEYKRRVDLRNVRMVTIDGEDAKDLDDAVSIEKLPNGNYKLGVHIADVSHYVREKNPLDKEALNRGTSVYLIDRVIPMLPKQLSNGICSLNPKVDRLTLSCIMTIDNTGKVLGHEVVESIIKTDERMTYTDVTKILKGDEALINKYEYLYEDFKIMEELSTILTKKRDKRGAIDFDFEESKIILNELGKPIDIKPYERAIANKIIEEFMLICNETVAEHMFWTHLPFVYRVHENPHDEKLEKFKEFVYNLGYAVRWGQEVHPRHLQEVLEKVKGKKEETVVSTLLLRSMMQARYSPECTGHFGLAAKYYCHFTSPIRRYPDLQIHRIIKEQINGKIDESRMKSLTAAVEYASKQSSETERIAQDAEREVDDLKKAEYMLDRVGQEFEGMVSSVTNFGLFVELPNTIEGLVHITSLDDDYYVYDEDHLCLIGERTKKVYRLGDTLKVKCNRVDIANREVYFELANSDEELEEIKATKKLLAELSDVKQELQEQKEELGEDITNIIQEI